MGSPMQQFEAKDTHDSPLMEGDYVRCIRKTGNPTIAVGGIYKIKSIADNGAIIVDETNIGYGEWPRCFEYWIAGEKRKTLEDIGE